ncbi:MAG TPA: glucose-1-phosphate adenylyltransferase, partial [bacterium]|nr:glucose-1-phosphate adenylyltransferase [bacterium]
DLFDENWQFFTRPRYLPLSKFTGSTIDAADIAEGTIVERSRITHSIIGLRSVIGAGTVIEDSIILGNDFYGRNGGDAGRPPLGIGRNCVIRKAIIDKNVHIGDGVQLVNREKISEFENEHCVIRNGIIVIPKNTVIPAGTVI